MSLTPSTICRTLFLCWGTLWCSVAASGQELDNVLEDYFRVWRTGEVEQLKTLVTPGFIRHAGPDDSCASRRDLTRLVEQTLSTYKNLELRIDDLMTEGEKGALRGSFYGVHREVDRIVEFPLMSMFRFEDGLLAEEWILGNNFLVLVGLGFQLTPPGFEVTIPEEGDR